MAPLLCILLPLAAALQAEVKLPSIVSDGMVLQRGTPLELWGWASPGEAVRVSFRGERYETRADPNGDWSLLTDSFEAGGPYELTISASNQITVSDVLVGDVWLCSGQSNMTHAFNRWQEEYATEIAASENTEIRQFYVPTNPVLSGPIQDTPPQAWKAANPRNLLDFTVVGYFFAKKIHDTHSVPQGIIMSCVGGTRIEAWTSENGFKQFPKLLETIERNKDAAYVARVNQEAKADREAHPPIETIDQGLSSQPAWYDPAYPAPNWKPINVPGYWEHQGVRDLDGVVWYRREVDVPKSMLGTPLTLKLGRIRNADDVYLNGKRIGGTTYEYPQRRYTVPADLLQAGSNLLVLRVSNSSGNGGFIPDKPYQLEGAGQTIDLKGTWLYRVGEVYRPNPHRYKSGINAQSQPAALYNGMIAPLTRYPIRGALWYQGESNAGDPEAYAKLLPNLIENWRQEWDNPELTFLIAQLPRFMDVDYLPAESNWALMREAQMDTARALPHTGIGINIDLGEWNDIHPGKKKPVGERLALQALKLSYGAEIVASGPTFLSQEIKDGTIELSFENVGSGLVSNNGEALAHFAIAGADKAFVWAEAKIEGEKVLVWSDEIKEPRFVRYAWADNPDFANLANREGLPAAPFRSDP